MKRRALTISFAALLGAVLIVALILRRSRDTGAVAIEPGTPASSEVRDLAQRVDSVPPVGVEDQGARVEAKVVKQVSDLELELQTEGAPLAQFKARLVYESTGQAVPWCGVRLRGVGRQNEFCATDEEGRFHSRLTYPLARTLLLVVDQRSGGLDWSEASEVHREDDDAELTLSVRVAPTIVLAGGFPEDVDPQLLMAWVPCGAGSHTGMKLRRGGEHWFVREHLQEYAWRLDPRRIEQAKSEPSSADPELQRFIDEAKPSEPPWRVWLDSERPSWRGSAEFNRFEGVITFAPHWEVFGDVAIVFNGNWAKAPTWWIDVELRPGLADVEPASGSGWLNELAKEPMRISRLAPGQYTLVTRCDECDEVELPVIVRGTETTTVDVQLKCEINAGSIYGEIMSDSGEEPSAEVLLDLSRPGMTWFGNIKLVRDPTSAPWRATFEIKDVPAGDFKLMCWAGEFGIEPSYLVSTRAGEFVRFRVLDRPEYVDLGFRVFDRESGAELETFNIDYFRGGTAEFPRGLSSGAIVALHVPVNGRLRWSVTSSGHTCVEGDLANQANWGKSDGARRWIDVRLPRGWSTKCSAYDTDYLHLSGATILADGIEVGTTDADGNFILTLPARPKSLDMRYRDWRCIERDERGLDTIESCDWFSFIFERKR